MIKNYDDIINLPHPTSKKHPKMSIYDRASQFAPFAALTGHADQIYETGRIVDKKKELTLEEKELISDKLNFLLENVSNCIEVSITYFIPDKKKIGGEYVKTLGIVKSYDVIDKTIKLTNKQIIKIEDILTIESEYFNFNE